MPERRITVPAELETIPRLVAAAADFCAECGLLNNHADEVSVVLEELLTNLVVHGTGGSSGHQVEVALMYDSGRLTLVFADDGLAFDPSAYPEPELKGEVEDRPVGGLGIHLVRTIMDRMEYARHGERNSLTLHKVLTWE